MATQIRIGQSLTVVRGERTYNILRLSRSKYEVALCTDTEDIHIGDFKSYVKAADAIAAHDNAASVVLIPSTLSAIANVQYMAEKASSPQARRFWTLRLNRMVPAL